MEKDKKRAKILETKYFGLIIGLIIVLLFTLISQTTAIFDNLEQKMLDVNFNYKNVFLKENIQEGVSLENKNPQISPDILIVGIDFKSLDKFGKWPFPRWREADLINSFARIKNQNERERALFLDVFFIDPDENAIHDGLMINSLKENGRVFLETVLDETPPPAISKDDYFMRHELLYKAYGEIKNIKGDWASLPAFYGLQPPLQPYAAAVKGYGHANFLEDHDKIYRRQALVAKSSVLLTTLKLDDLTPDTSLDYENYQRFEWVDKNNIHHTVSYPHTEEVIRKLKASMGTKAPLKTVDNDKDGNPDESYYVIRKYQDHFIPSITLSLALEYFNKELSDIDILLGKYIFIPHPEYFDIEQNKWIPYNLLLKPAVYNENGEIVEKAKRKVLNEIKIPIDENGGMLINYMGLPSFATAGERQTFPIRSFSGYASNPPGTDPAVWPKTKAVGNKIIMVGPFARGMAEDLKTTPFGLMYGVEIHANSLNTILMNKFLLAVPFWVDFAVLFILVMFISFMTSRLSTVWSMIITIFLIVAAFIGVTIVFDQMNFIVNFSTPAIAIFFAFLSIVVYRVMTEEKDKRRIRNMFSTYVSPKVVDKILEAPPELGGIDKTLTVFFSDIRGFTSLSERMTPQELVLHLNKYLTAMTDIILEYEGTLDKYEGDAIMSFWGAPVNQEDHALRACRSSLKQIEALKDLNKDLPEEKQINIGIGLNSGIMTVGNMGSIQRMDYTVMGDPVNLGSRLEGSNKQYGTNIIISEYTYGYVKDHVIARELDNIRVKGKNKPVLVYELIDIKEDESETTESNNETKTKEKIGAGE